MTRPRLNSYLRTRRLEHGLSQVELAALVGMSPDTISDYEIGRTAVSAEMLIAGEIIFGEHPSRLFPAFYERVQDEIGARAVRMCERLEDDPGEGAKRKRHLLEGIPGRTVSFDYL